MSSTTMHFGPEWMRTKHQTPTRTQPPPSPPPAGAPPSGASTYSALVSPAPPQRPERLDDVHPFRYSKEELLRIYREGGGKGGLGLEVERWEGVVREVGNEPIGLREMGDIEKKLFQGPLNSDLRRRQSTDLLSPLSTQGLGIERSRLNLNSPASATASPLKDRFSVLKRRDSADQSIPTIPRKQSLSSLQPTSPREAALPSPRRGPGYTSGFDGILGGGESWVARRRASEASLKAGTGASREGGDYSTDGKAPDIREEEEDARHEPDRNSHSAADPRDPDNTTSSHSTGPSVLDGQDAAAEMASLSLGSNGTGVPGSLGGLLNSVPVAPPLDLATVEWSYKDPSGQIQGPFNAELMQKWYDDGYFTGDLPMKRTHLESQWVTVDELVKRHGPNKTFLSPPLPIVPPGLAHRDSQNFAQDPLLFNGPYQPAPIRNLRSSTLDSFGSNPSDSPSSSFGAGRFGNGSPDPNAFGGRGAFFGDTAVGSRAQNFAAIPDPAAAFSRRNTFHDPSMDPSLAMRSPTFGNIMPGRGAAADGFSYNRTYSPGQGWNTVPFDSSNGNRGSVDPFSSPFVPGPTNNFGNFGTSQDTFSDGATFQNADYNHFVNGPSPSQLYAHSSAAPYQQPTQNVYGLQTTTTPQTISSDMNPSPTPSQSLWNNEAPAPRRPGPFGVEHPTSTNTVVVQPIVDTLPWGQAGQPSRPSSQVNESSPWVPPSQGLVEDSWTTAPGTDSLTFSNVGQHNQQQQLASANETVANDVESSVPSDIIPITEAAPAPEPAATKAVSLLKAKAKAAAQANQLSPSPKTALPTPVVPEPSPPSAAPKAAWSKEDESKTKPSGVSMSLREIQEAEAKKAEARKAAERERERAARAAAPPVDGKDAAQPFTASWGLPTSQAGARTSAPAVKEPSAIPSPAGTPVWTNAPKAAATKKTMKEIQEEEEKRKKNATKETVAAAAARRAYAETTQKVTTPALQGSAWTTVGPSGKPTPAATPARPPVTPSTSNLNVPSARPNGNAAPRTVSVSPVIKPAPLTPKSDDPVAPSHEFVTWLTGSLKGLNSSVNVEEIISMLLSFSLDPDPSTVELISELIYANSTTLDGRRFAAEFISKRKADAVSRAKAPGKGPSKPVSIADVVKAAPKSTQPEWGFKVVNKKKKGGRS